MIVKPVIYMGSFYVKAPTLQERGGAERWHVRACVDTGIIVFLGMCNIHMLLLTNELHPHHQYHVVPSDGKKAPYLPVATYTSFKVHLLSFLFNKKLHL